MNNTKVYLFATISSSFLLLLALPAAATETLWLPTHIATICALSLLSISAGGLASEAFEIARKSSLIETTRINDTKRKTYFLALASSILFLAIVAPSMQFYVERWGISGIATVIILLILSIAVAGLASEGIFSLTKIRARTTNSDDEKKLGAISSPFATNQSETSDVDILSHIDSDFKVFDASQERRIHELKQQLINVLDGKHYPIEPNVTREVKYNPGATKESSQKDLIVDTLLGKEKVVGGAK
jgi:hypothetical protein